MKGLFAPLFPVFFLLSSSILALFKTFRNSDVFALILKRTILVKYYWYKLRTILLQALTPFCRLVVLQSESVSLTAHCSLSRLAPGPEQGSLHSKWRMAWHCTGDCPCNAVQCSPGPSQHSPLTATSPSPDGAEPHIPHSIINAH